MILAHSGRSKRKRKADYRKRLNKLLRKGDPAGAAVNLGYDYDFMGLSDRQAGPADYSWLGFKANAPNNGTETDWQGWLFGKKSKDFRVAPRDDLLGLYGLKDASLDQFVRMYCIAGFAEKDRIAALIPYNLRTRFSQAIRKICGEGTRVKFPGEHEPPPGWNQLYDIRSLGQIHKKRGVTKRRRKGKKGKRSKKEIRKERLKNLKKARKARANKY